MISFKELEPNNSVSELTAPSELCPQERSLFEECVGSILDEMKEDTGVEYGITVFGGALLVRRYDEDGDYSFAYPIPLCESFDGGGCLVALADYAVKERIQFCLFDVPTDGLSEISRLFKNFDVRLLSGECDRYFVRLHNELAFVERRLPELPLCFEGTELTEVTEEDVPDLARLNYDPRVNRFWGYDFREDVKDATPQYFFDVISFERECGIALSLAIRTDGEFIGEAVLSNFDYRGGCELSLRIFAGWQGKRHGSHTLSLLFEIAGALGLVCVYATVMEENLPSLRLMSGCMEKITHEGGVVRFCRQLV